MDGVAGEANRLMTAQDVLVELGSVVPLGHARLLMTRARRVVGLRRGPTDEALETLELLMILEAIASEGGDLQRLAQTLAHRALDPRE